MHVIVAGAGVIGSQVTRRLVGNRHDVVVIDVDREVCESVHAHTGAMTVHASATDIQVLDDAGAQKADVVLCLMRNDADNIACALLSRSLGVSRVVARLRNPRYEQAYKSAGVTSIVRVADLLLNQIMVEVEQPEVRKIMTLRGGKADIYAVGIPSGATSVGLSIKEIASQSGFPRECVFMGVYKEEEDEFYIPRGDQVLDEEDTVFLVSKSQHIKQATDFLTRTK
ncbi:MAG: potassium channel family protein [bacterium]